MVVWKHCVNTFYMGNTARKDAFCRFWSSGHIPAIQSPVLRVRQCITLWEVQQTPQTHTEGCAHWEWDTEYSVLFLMAAFHLKEILKDMICSSLLKIINSVRCLRINGGPNLLNPHFGLGKCLNQFFQTLTIPEVTLAMWLCNIQQLWGSQIMTGKSHRSPWK